LKRKSSARPEPSYALGGQRNDLPVAGDGLKATVVSTEWDVEPDDSLARGNEVEVFGGDTSLGSSGVVEEFDLLKETGLVVLVESWAGFLLYDLAHCEGAGASYQREYRLDTVGRGEAGGTY
jgi:hypothetical protein